MPAASGPFPSFSGTAFPYSCLVIDAIETMHRTSAVARGRAAFATACTLCTALLLAAYGNFFHNEFHFDDSHVLVNNAYLRSLRNVPSFFADARTFSSNPMNCTYRPLVSVSLALDHALAGGLNPVAFHAGQLLLMILLGALLVSFYRTVMDETRPGPWNAWLALFAAGLFCLHVVNTETMNLMHARSEILSALGLVGGFLLYVRSATARRTHLYLVPIVLGALAKLPAVLFGPLLFVWILLEPPVGNGRGSPHVRWSTLRRAAVGAAPAVLLGLLLTVFTEKIMNPDTQTYGGGNRFHYALTQIWVWVHYVKLLFFPVGLTADTDLKLVTGLADDRVFAGAFVIGLLAVAAWLAARRAEGRPIAFGLAWFALGLAPTSSVLPLAEPMNEHRIFLPWIGLILALVWAARLSLEPMRSAGGKPFTAILGASCALVLAGHALASHARNEVWRTDESLWEDVTRKSPANGRAWMNYGVALMSEGQYVRAKECYERALALNANYYVLHVNLGVLNGATGDQAAAEDHFRSALELAPNDPVPHFYFARYLAEHARGPEAIPHLEETLRLSPADENARLLLIDLQAARGDTARARALAREHLGLGGDGVRARALAGGTLPSESGSTTYESYFDQGLALGRRESFLESALAYRSALALQPRSSDALNNLGWTLGRLGFYSEAVPLLEAALEEKPDFRLARNNLAWVKSKMR